MLEVPVPRCNFQLYLTSSLQCQARCHVHDSTMITKKGIWVLIDCASAVPGRWRAGLGLRQAS